MSLSSQTIHIGVMYCESSAQRCSVGTVLSQKFLNADYDGDRIIWNSLERQQTRDLSQIPVDVVRVLPYDIEIWVQSMSRTGQECQEGRGNRIMPELEL